MAAKKLEQGDRLDKPGESNDHLTYWILYSECLRQKLETENGKKN